jgi:hypothetical protein
MSSNRVNRPSLGPGGYELWVNDPNLGIMAKVSYGSWNIKIKEILSFSPDFFSCFRLSIWSHAWSLATTPTLRISTSPPPQQVRNYLNHSFLLAFCFQHFVGVVNRAH